MTKQSASRGRQRRDLAELMDYRAYEGPRSGFFEEQWLRPRLRALGYTHVRFFGGEVCEYDGSFRERVCELKRDGAPVEYRVYG